MRILAFIPARGGSKRIPKKNIRQLGQAPLIVWTIAIVRDVAEVCDILVSTDDEEISAVACRAGASVPWVRPSGLSTDSSSSVDVCLHALDWYEAERGAVDGLMLLQPTSPFRRRRSVIEGIEQFGRGGGRTVIGVSLAGSHPYWCFRICDGRLRPFFGKDELELRSQELPSAYVVNGAYYLISPENLRRNHSFYGDDVIPLVMPGGEEAIDIDCEWDWKLAEGLVVVQGYVPYGSADAVTIDGDGGATALKSRATEVP